MIVIFNVRIKKQNPAYCLPLLFLEILMTITKKFFWLVPFFCFILTYFILHKIFSIAPFATPSVIGKPIQEALTILAEHTLNSRLISQTEDNDLPAGIVLSQQPLAHQKVRPYQTVFLTISKHKERIPAPDLTHKSLTFIKNYLEKDGISFKSFGLMSPSPQSSCIAQLPQPTELLGEDKKMIIYTSLGMNKPVILPLFKGYAVDEVVQFLNEHTVKTTLFHAKPVAPEHRCLFCKVIEQKPLAGSIIDLKKPLTVQLYVR